MAKIIYQCITLLHELWLQRCHIIHIKLADGVEIEEKVELINKLKQIRTNKDLPLSLQKYQDFSNNQITKLLLDKIKGILFEVYSTINNKEAHNKINC